MIIARAALIATVVMTALTARADGAKRVELLRNVPATVRVSSRVANKTILPAHLVDQDRQTAWNSRTGDLVGAWIEVGAQGGAIIDEVRLTVGHTGTGPHHEDYFTMNPRIAAVTITVDGSWQGDVALDLEQRDLQTIKLKKPGALVRITVAKIVPGSKASWREACVSELEAWGTPPPGFAAPAKPLAPSVEVGEATAIKPDPCAYVAPMRRDWERHQDDCATCVDRAGEPWCDAIALTIADRAAPWAGGTLVCKADDGTYDPPTCDLTIAAGDETITIDDGHDLVRLHPLELIDARALDLIAGGAPELVVRYREHDRDNADRLLVCRATPFSCTAPIATSGGSDGDPWTTTPRFARGQVVLDAATGTPPAGVLGAHALVFK